MTKDYKLTLDEQNTRAQRIFGIEIYFQSSLGLDGLWVAQDKFDIQCFGTGKTKDAAVESLVKELNKMGYLKIKDAFNEGKYLSSTHNWTYTLTKNITENNNKRNDGEKITMNKTQYKIIFDKILEEISKKNSWGKTELKELIVTIYIEVLHDALEEEEQS